MDFYQRFKMNNYIKQKKKIVVAISRAGSEKTATTQKNI